MDKLSKTIVKSIAASGLLCIAGITYATQIPAIATVDIYTSEPTLSVNNQPCNATQGTCPNQAAIASPTGGYEFPVLNFTSSQFGNVQINLNRPAYQSLTPAGSVFNYKHHAKLNLQIKRNAPGYTCDGKAVFEKTVGNYFICSTGWSGY